MQARFPVMLEIRFSFPCVKTSKKGQRQRGKSDFCLPDFSKSGRAALKVEQKVKKLGKCSTRLPSPKQCGLRLRANLKNWRFARNGGLHFTGRSQELAFCP